MYLDVCVCVSLELKGLCVCVSLRGEGTMYLGVCYSGVKGPCVWVCVTQGEGTVCLGVCHSGEGRCIWVCVTQG